MADSSALAEASAEAAQGRCAYGKRRPELVGMLGAEHALLVQRSRAWQDVVVPVCKEIDEERSKPET